jgi:hypothetical protein
MDTPTEARPRDNDQTGLKPILLRLVGFLLSRFGTLALCFFFTLAMLYNYVLPLNSLSYTKGIKGQDCGQMVWNLWFANEAITHGHNPYQTSMVYYPLGANLVHHTLAAGFFPVTFIVKLVTRGDPLYPIYSYRIIVLLSFTLILYFSYLLLRELGLTVLASATAAVAYTFSDFYILHVLHINHLAGFFIPLTALLLARFYKRPDSLNLIGAALIAAWAIYFTELTVYIYVGVILIALMMCALAHERSALRSRLRAAGRRRLIISASVFALIASPFIINLFTDSVRKPPPVEASHYSANLAGFFVPGQEPDEAGFYGAPYMTPLYGHAFHSLDSRITVGMGGFEVFVGFPLLILGLLAAIGSKKRWVRMCVVASLIFFALSLGPTLKILGTDTNIPMPYALLMHVPPFDSGRTPVRIVCIALFFLMIVGAEGFALFERFLRRRAGYRWASLIMLLLFAWTVAEVYSPTERREPFKPADLSRIVNGPVLNLPPAQSDGYAAMLQTFHHQPIATGYLARNNEAQWAYFADLKQAFDKGGAPFCAYVSQLGFRNIVISPGAVIAPYSFSTVPLDLDHCAINVIDLRATDSLSSGPAEAKPNGAEQPQGYPVLPTATRIDFGTNQADPYLWYGWSRREVSSRWTDRGRAALVFSLPQPKGRTKLTLLIFGGPFVAPGKLDAQRVQVELNDQPIANWTISRAEPQGRAIEIPVTVLREKNVLVFRLPDAASPRTLGVSEDWRLLGFNVQWIEID